MKRERGRFIVLEGGEGAGKSTCARLIRGWLRAQGRAVLMTREPGGTPLAERIRELLLQSRGEMAPMSELLLMFAARVSHIRERILPALESGKDVVCDRFVDSSYAYQCGGRGLPARDIAVLERITLGGLRPDLVLVLDLPPRVGLSRVGRRGAADRFERAGLAFQQRVRRTFLQRARAAPQRYRVIDASRPLESVRKQLLKVLEYRL